MEIEKIIVRKKRAGLTEGFNREKIHAAIRKSADRVLYDLTDKDCMKVSDAVLDRITEPEITVRKLHKLVEVSLDECGFNKVAESYRQYRNYKIDAQKIMEAVDAKTLELSYKADKSNANCDSSLVSTKRSLIYGEQQKERYRRVFLNEMEREALADGYIYAHDQSARLDSYNCSLFDLGNLLNGGFMLSNTEYNEPQSLQAAISVTADILSVIAGNQYGGLTAPEIDTVLAPYAEKSYKFYSDQYKELIEGAGGVVDPDKLEEYAVSRVKREAETGFQQIEMSSGSVASCRGDFPSTK